MDVGANLGCVDNTVLFYEHVITDVEREKSNPVAEESFIQMAQCTHCQAQHCTAVPCVLLENQRET